MAERFAWVVIASWLVLAWVQAQLPDAPLPKPTQVSQQAQTPDPKPQSTPLPAQTPAPAPQAAAKPIEPSPAPAPQPIPSSAEDLAQQAQKETNPYLKASLFLQAEKMLAERQQSEARRAEYLAKAANDAKESPLAAEACIRYLDMVLDRPNPGHPAQLVNQLIGLLTKHGVGPGMIDAARVQHIIDRLQPQFSGEAKRLQALLDPPAKAPAPPAAQADAATPEKPAPPAPTSAIERALLTKNPLRFDPVIPDPGKTIPLRLTRKNPTTLPITETFTWTVPQGSAWTPETLTQTFTYLPGQSVDITFNFAVSPQPGASLALAPELTSSFTAPGFDPGQPLARRSSAFKIDMARYYQKLMIAYANRVNRPPVIDGKLDDEAWVQCLPISHFIKYDGSDKIPYPTEVRIGWDDDALYVMAKAAEPDLPGIWTKATTRNGDVWTDDSLEVMFDFDPVKRGFMQFIVSANNTPYDANAHRLRWDTIWTSKTGREKDAWTLEASIPWRAVEAPVPKVGDKVGFQLVRNRVRQSDHSFWQWSPTFVHSNLVPNRFGTLVFTGPPPGIIPASGK
jgi:hypothetical protein